MLSSCFRAFQLVAVVLLLVPAVCVRPGRSKQEANVAATVLETASGASSESRDASRTAGAHAGGGSEKSAASGAAAGQDEASRGSGQVLETASGASSESRDASRTAGADAGGGGSEKSAASGAAAGQDEIFRGSGQEGKESGLESKEADAASQAASRKESESARSASGKETARTGSESVDSSEQDAAAKTSKAQADKVEAASKDAARERASKQDLADKASDSSTSASEQDAAVKPSEAKADNAETEAKSTLGGKEHDEEERAAILDSDQKTSDLEVDSSKQLSEDDKSSRKDDGADQKVSGSELEQSELDAAYASLQTNMGIGREDDAQKSSDLEVRRDEPNSDAASVGAMTVQVTPGPNKVEQSATFQIAKKFGWEKACPKDKLIIGPLFESNSAFEWDSKVDLKMDKVAGLLNVTLRVAARVFENAPVKSAGAKDKLTLKCIAFPDATPISVDVTVMKQPVASPVWPWVPQEISTPPCLVAGTDFVWNVSFKHQVSHKNFPLIGTVNDGILDERRQKTAKAEAAGAKYTHETADVRGKEAGADQSAVGGYRPMLSGLSVQQRGDASKGLLAKAWKAVARRGRVSWDAGEMHDERKVDDGTYIKSIQVEKNAPNNVTVVLKVPPLKKEVESGELSACFVPDDGYNLYAPICDGFKVAKTAEECSKLLEKKEEPEPTKAPSSGALRTTTAAAPAALLMATALAALLAR